MGSERGYGDSDGSEVVWEDIKGLVGLVPAVHMDI